MSPSIKASVSYKKKDGSLTVSDDKKYLFWTPAQPPGASPSVTVPVADITNLQQTPESSAKIALKVFIKEESHVFSFTSKDAARKEQEAVTNTLRDIIAANKAGVTAQLAPAAAASTPGKEGGDGGQSAAMAIAKAVSSKQDDSWYDDNKLKNDVQLQRSLLAANKPLNDRFAQALKDKPESVSVAQFNTQFWSTRLHLLRAFAIEKAQKEGEYNVLPEIKYKTIIGDNGEPTKQLSVTGQQIKLIFKQYPVVRQAYNETVPKQLNENSFWQRFFQSRLLKKIKGDRIDRIDPQDPVLDRYLDLTENRGPASLSHVPQVIDLEGNEWNTSYKVNREGWEMRAERHDEPLFHTLNNLSTKLLSHVAPEDSEAHGPIGMDEETFQQLQLRDLARNDEDNRAVLNVREQQRHVGAAEDDLSADARRYRQQDPCKVLSELRSGLHPSHLGSDDRGSLRLDQVIGFNSDGDDSDDDDDVSAPQTKGARTKSMKASTRIGSHTAISSATSNILSSINNRRSHATDTTSNLQGLSQDTFDTLTITHNTTTEFLHYFWTLFHSGDSSKASELASLINTLNNSLDRINAVAEQAEKERQGEVEKARKYVKQYYERTGKKRKLDESQIRGGRAVVEAIVRPTVGALREAIDRYRSVLEVQTKEMQAAAAVG
ncbi:general transcription and DNA repair factor IIH subunit tcf-29-like [Teratosphaeria destructans]|uniref:General transcription and DNA repair factor IIH subunit tcf-29-like n=1 Tax=Teratosphaeria destructans TaxID=418781 RepID=A0A9W7VY36_9PEZI|nr:general transcription and DNA repair factor IIH subunit tcf-29-like [Teratosphaeria destructans]